MERLSREKRKEFLKRAVNLQKEAYIILERRTMSSRNVYEMDLYEILMRKYRMVSCIKLLDDFGRGERFADMNLMDLYKSFNAVKCIEDDDSFEILYELIYDTSYCLNESFLHRCLVDTGWEIHSIDELKDYEELDEDVIKTISGIITVHWEMMRRHYQEASMKDSEYLRSLGCEPDDIYLDMDVDCNLVLTNKNVEEMLNICSKNTEYQKWDEYQELSQIQYFIMFDRVYPDVSLFDLNQPNWKCISYLLGGIPESDEEVGMPWLKYESVLYLILADMIAQDFLERYHSLEVAAA